MTVGPSAEARAGFGVVGPAVLLEGGQGEAFQVGDLVLKPAEDGGESAWVAELLERLVVAGVRVAEPVRALDSSWVVDGWSATRWVAGETGPSGRWEQLLDVCDRLSSALIGAPRPPFLAGRDHRWARAQRMTWGEAPIASELASDPSVARLLGLLRDVDLPDQLIHGDLCGNVLFDPVLPPAVIDWSLYWRPAAYARAVAGVDGLLWYGAGDELAVAEAERVGARQMLVRALLFRLLVDRLAQEELGDRGAFPPRYLEVVDLVAGLVAG